MNRRVVVTGLGVVSPIGIGKDIFWRELINGTSGIKKVTLFDTGKFKCHYAGEIRDFNPSDFIPRSKVKFFGRASQFAITAAKLALEDADINISEYKKSARIAVIMGTTLPEGDALDSSSAKIVKGQFGDIAGIEMLNLFSPAMVRNVGYTFNLEGKNVLLPNACAAGNYAISYGFDLIKNNEIDLAIAGGGEALSRIAFQGFLRLYAMASEKCQPFDKNRQGMMLGEGAGILILEDYEHALKRKAPIYAEVLGYGLSSDAHHMTIPNQEGVKKAMKKALDSACLTPDKIDYICAHGTGTAANDKNETNAIKEIFADNYKQIPVSSIKSMLGHCMGAASAIEAAACCLAIQNGVVPPTTNFETPDPECDIDCVPNEARKKKINAVLNNGFAFGGNNCCVVFADKDNISK